MVLLPLAALFLPLQSPHLLLIFLLLNSLSFAIPLEIADI